MSTPAPSGACERCGQPAKVYAAEGDASFVFRVISRACEACEADLTLKWDREERADMLPKLLAKAGMIARLEPLTLHTYPRDTAGEKTIGVAREWFRSHISGQRRNLLLFGDVGSGKSGLAWGLTRALVEHVVEKHFEQPRGERGLPPSCPALFVVLRDLLGEMRRSFGNTDTEFPLLQRVRTTPVLVLDDLGAERPTDWARDELAQLVEHRYGHGLPVVATSNYDPDALARRLGHDDPIIGRRIVSRITERAIQVEFRAADRRLAA